MRGGGGFPASAAQDGVGVAEGGPGHGGRCPGGGAQEDTHTMPGGEPINLAGLAFVLATSGCMQPWVFPLVTRFALVRVAALRGGLPCCGSSVWFRTWGTARSLIFFPCIDLLQSQTTLELYTQTLQPIDGPPHEPHQEPVSLPPGRERGSQPHPRKERLLSLLLPHVHVLSRLHSAWGR